MAPVRRSAFVHEAVLTMPDGADECGPGGAITLALCGSWEHPPPCPLAPHQTSVEPTEHGLRVRTLFVAEPGREPEVRRLIEGALARRHHRGPDGAEADWVVVSCGPGSVASGERDLAARLLSS